MKVTFCLTSCKRPDLLEITLDSFLRFNTYPIEKYIVSEDSNERMIELERKYPFIKFVYNEDLFRLGMMRNLNRVYSFAETEYIFSCEDDWFFYRSGFIEQSMKVLQADKNIIQCWLREPSDTNGHPVESKLQRIGGVKCRYMAEKYLDVFSGYSTNPALKRKSDVVNFGEIIKDCSTNGEHLVSQWYYEKGFRAVIFLRGFVKHIGEGRTVI